MNATSTITRRSYTAPTLVRHGQAVEQTRGGIIGWYTEYWGWSRIPRLPSH